MEFTISEYQLKDVVSLALLTIMGDEDLTNKVGGKSVSPFVQEFSTIMDSEDADEYDRIAIETYALSLNEHLHTIQIGMKLNRQIQNKLDK